MSGFILFLKAFILYVYCLAVNTVRASLSSVCLMNQFFNMGQVKLSINKYLMAIYMSLVPAILIVKRLRLASSC